MILHGILGLRADPNGLRLEPYLPDEMGPVEVSGIHYRGQTLHVVLRGSGRRVVKAMVDGANVASARIPEEGEGTREVLVELAS
jgi:cellobiose phosphorylase